MLAHGGGRPKKPACVWPVGWPGQNLPKVIFSLSLNVHLNFLQRDRLLLSPHKSSHQRKKDTPRPVMIYTYCSPQTSVSKLVQPDGGDTPPVFCSYLLLLISCISVLRKQEFWSILTQFSSKKQL